MTVAKCDNDLFVNCNSKPKQLLKSI